MRKHQATLNLGTFYKLTVRSIKVMKVKGLKNCSRLKETKNIQQINAMCGGTWLASVSRAGDSGFQGYEFELQVGSRVYLKRKKKVK